MPERVSTPLGAPCWVDLYTSDPDRATEFYGQLFGWTARSASEEYGGYLSFFKNGRLVAGGRRNDGQTGTLDSWSIYLATDDAQATADSAASHGGQVLVSPMQVGDMGTMAVLADAGQAPIGIWQAGTHHGFQIADETDTPRWFELHTRDYEAAVRFYEEVFGWDTSVVSDTPDFRYTTLGRGRDAQAGILDARPILPEGGPAHWSIYFGADNAEATLAKVEQLGGSIVRAARDAPLGRLSEAADPTGAIFKLISAS